MLKNTMLKELNLKKAFTPFPLEVISSDTVRLFTRFSYLPIPDGTNMEIYSGNESAILKIKKSVHEGLSEKDGHLGQIFTVTFEQDIPYTVTEETLFLSLAWEPDLYTCKNSTFKNIAGAGHLSRIDHMRISNCTYQNMMNSGILMGTEFPTHVEGGHVTDTVISNCTFKNSLICIDIHDAYNINVKNCKFLAVDEKICTDFSTSEKICIDLSE